MEEIIRDVRELSGDERSAAEGLVGHPLAADQRLVIQVVDVDSAPIEKGDCKDDDRLPDWCDVYAGLSDDRIAELERAISRRLDLTRSAT